MGKPAWEIECTQTKNLFSFFTSKDETPSSSPSVAAATSTTTTMTASSMISNNSSAGEALSTNMDDSILSESAPNNRKTKSPKVSSISSPGQLTTTDVGSSDPLTPGGESNSNISLPSLSNFPLENREELKKMYLAGFRHASAKYRATVFGRGLQPELIGILSPQGGTGLPKEEEVNVEEEAEKEGEGGGGRAANMHANILACSRQLDVTTTPQHPSYELARVDRKGTIPFTSTPADEEAAATVVTWGGLLNDQLRTAAVALHSAGHMKSSTEAKQTLGKY